jgi:predicted RNA-binding Zn-ribbon protein involved in translation (DUF1610 family)
MGLGSELYHFEPCKILENFQKLHIQILVVMLKMPSCGTLRKNRKQKSEKHGHYFSCALFCGVRQL